MSIPRLTIDPALSINEIIKRHPASIGVLNAHGLDTCCGGGESLRSAALEARVDLRTLVQEIVATAVLDGSGTAGVR